MLAAAAAWLGISHESAARESTLSALDETRLRALADAVLPTELGARGRAEVVDGFLRWMRNYREGAEMDHGYGFTRLRRTPPSPALRYAAQLADLDRGARERGFPFEQLEPGARQQVIAAALRTKKVDRLPARPTGDHIAIDLMAFYFNSPDANDLAYGVAIRRDQCRGLNDSDKRPAFAASPLPPPRGLRRTGRRAARGARL
jgi:hypothetical protein